MENINLHFNIAEKGKCFALEGKHKDALRHYQEAIRMCQKLPNPDIFMQHYSLCVMESLELMGNHQEVIDFCERYINFLNAKNLENSPLMQKYLASLWERIGVQYLFMTDKERAKKALETSKSASPDYSSGLAVDLLNWIYRGFTITQKQIKEVQNKHRYFTVRKENVNKGIAIEIPSSLSPTLNF